MKKTDNRISEVLITYDQIANRAIEAAKWIDDNYQNQQPILIGILKGCIPWMQEVFKHVSIDAAIDFMAVSSYNGAHKSSGVAKIVMDINAEIEGKDVIIVEDIIDSGVTISKIKEYLKIKNAKSVKILTFLDKKLGRKVELEADWVGFDVPLKFLVGFGLDYQEIFRNIPFVGVLNESVYQ